MEILLGILAVLVLIVIGVLLAASVQPKEFKIERSTTTTATKEEVYAVISDLSRFQEWSPWHKHDPNIQVTLTGAPGEVGATQSWEGNKDVGAGRMTITNVVPHERVDIKLDFFKPFESTSTTAWIIEDAGDHRRIRWIMEGRNDKLIMRVMGLFMSMDKMVGKDFEAGLASLKQLLERPSAATAS